MKCKYCGQEHPNIGLTIIPSCVDKRIEKLETALRDAISVYDKPEFVVTPERIEAWEASLNNQ